MNAERFLGIFWFRFAACKARGSFAEPDDHATFSFAEVFSTTVGIGMAFSLDALVRNTQRALNL